jgi:PAS domain S-box-containing protein
MVKFGLPGKFNLKLAHQGLMLVLVPLIFELLFLATLGWLLNEAELQTKREASARLVAQTSERLDHLVYAAGSQMFLFAVTKNPQALQQYYAIVNQFKQEFEILKGLTASKPAIAQEVDRCALLGDKILDYLDDIKVSLEVPDRALVIAGAGGWKHKLTMLLKEYSDLMHSFATKQAEAEHADPRFSEKYRNLIVAAICAGFFANIVLALLLAAIFIGNTIERLKMLMDNNARLAAGKPLNELLRGGDEIAQLDKTFHEMANVLTASAERERALLEQTVSSETRLRLVIDCLPVGVMLLSEDGNIESLNPAAEKIFDCTSTDICGRSVGDLLDMKYDSGTFIENLRAKAMRHVTELAGKRNSGETVPLQLSMNEFEFSDGRKLVVSVLDITERYEIDRLKREFTAMVSHDLRSPLSSMLMSMELLHLEALGTLSDEARDEVSRTQKELDRLIKLINDLLDFEKLDAGKMELFYQDISLIDLWERSVTAVHRLADQRNITIVIPQQDELIYADADRLTQVIINLLSNAIKFSPDETSINITSSRTNGWLEVKVIDQGRGIPEAKKDQIFEKFKQVEKHDAKDNKGTGLGLAICKAIIEEHGGMIGVDSKEGIGSTFWFRIPCERTCTSTP